jgi:hypothetical protein
MPESTKILPKIDDVSVSLPYPQLYGLPHQSSRGSRSGFGGLAENCWLWWPKFALWG